MSHLDGVYIFPHGALCLNPGKYQFYEGLTDINRACFELANEIYDKNPETIILITPHGISLQYNFGIYLNEKVKGTAEWENAYQEYSFDGLIDSELSKSMLLYLQKTGNKVEGIVSFSKEEPIPLRWGEVIPLWFINQAYINNSLTPKKFPKIVVITLPQRRLIDNDNYSLINANSNTNFKKIYYENKSEDAIDFIKECHKLGRNIGEFINENNKKVIFIVSGDLAHKHVYPKQKKDAEKAESVGINFISICNDHENKNINDKNNFNLTSNNDNNLYNEISIKNDYNLLNDLNTCNLNSSQIEERKNNSKINLHAKGSNQELLNVNNVPNSNSSNRPNSLNKMNSKIIFEHFKNELKKIDEDDADLLDLSIKKWILSPIVNEQILLNALEFQKKFLSCGYFGFIMLLGFIKEFSEMFEEIEGEVLCCLHPTYYGMMVAKLKLKPFSDFVVVKNVTKKK